MGVLYLVDVLGGIVAASAFISALRKLIAKKGATGNQKEASITISLPDGQKIEAKMPAREAEQLVSHH